MTMRPPGHAAWRSSPAEIGGVVRAAFVSTFPQTPEAQLFVDKHWDLVHRGGGALFIHHIPSVLGEPVEFLPTGLPCYRPTPQPPEVWFVPDVPLGDLWPFARQMGFLTPKLPQAVADRCDSFLQELALRQPLGIEEVGEGRVIFRRYKDGGAFDIADMRRACELNVAVLGGPQDASHRNKSMPRHFVKMGFFYFGM
jgi:hypothetical protein